MLVLGATLICTGLVLFLADRLPWTQSFVRQATERVDATFSRLAAKESYRAIAGHAAGVASTVIGGVLFVRPYWEFGSGKVPGGHEFESNSGWIEVARKAIVDFHQLPLWNHWMGTGLPYLGDPLSHLFSPLALIPGLTLGALDGPRLAVVLTILASGLAEYYFAYVLGLNVPARVLSALVYMMNGQMMVRFGFGHFDFGLAYPYLPLTFALLIKAMQTKSGLLYPFLGGAAFAGLLFSGNVYYLVFALPGLLLAFLAFAVDRRSRIRETGLQAAFRASQTVAWALGLSAIQLIPWLETRPLVFKDIDRHLLGSLTITSSVRTLFESDKALFTKGAFGMVPGFIHEYYVYIGVFLIPLLVVSPLALVVGKRRQFFLLGSLVVLYVLLASTAHSPFRLAYKAFPVLYDFRWTSRELGLAMPFVPALAGLGLDALWSALRRLSGRISPPIFAYLTFAFLLVASAYVYLAAKDVFEANQPLYQFAAPDRAHLQIGDWLESQVGASPFFLDDFDGTGGVPVAYQIQGVKKLRAVWGWRIKGMETVVVDGKGKRYLQPAPRFLALRQGDPNRSDARFVAEIGGRRIYELMTAPPYAAFITRAEASQHPEAFEIPPPGGWAPWPFTQVSVAQASWPNTNEVLVSGSAEPGQETLMVLEAYVPGWRLEVDGQSRGKVSNVGGFLATDALPGDHTYRFVFAPAYAWHGIAVTLATLVIAFVIFIRGPATTVAARLRRS